jgi:hypothetical protein
MPGIGRRVRLGLGLVAMAALLGVVALLIDRRAGTKALSPVSTLADDQGFFFRPGLYVYERKTGEVRRIAEESAPDPSFGIEGHTFAWSGDAIVHSRSYPDEPGLRITRVTGDTIEGPNGLIWTVETTASGQVRVNMAADRTTGRPSGYGFIDMDTAMVEGFTATARNGLLSPDGSLTTDNEATGIDVSGAGSGARVASLPGLYDYPKSWAPDGKRLALSRYDDGALLSKRELVVWDWRAGATTTIGEGQSPVWAPDGQSVAFLTLEVGSGADAPQTSFVLVAPADGSKPPHRLVQGDADSWSPDGSRLAVVRDGGLFEVDVKKASATALVLPALPVISEPRYSPDGRYIAFRAGGGPGLIGTIDVDGTGERMIGLGFNPVWSPNGERIAFMYGRDPQGIGVGGAVYTMDADGGTIARVGPMSSGSDLARTVYPDLPCPGLLTADCLCGDWTGPEASSSRTRRWPRS